MNKIQVTAQQRANAIEARDVMWPSVPAPNVIPELSWWRIGGVHLPHDAPPDCGTVACFGGWCAWWPSFRAQGVTTAGNGAPEHNNNVAAIHLFGDSNIFNIRDTHPYADKGFVGTDHAMVLNRLNWLIENSEVVG